MSEKKHVWQSLSLPSRGEFYLHPDSKEPLIPDGKISIRRMDFEEENVMSSAGIDFIDRLNAIIENCAKLPCDPKVFKHTNLLVADRMAIVFMNRTLTFGAGYNFTYRCRGCASTNRAAIDIFKDFDEVTPEIIRSKLDEKDPPEVLEEPWTIRMPDTNYLLQLRLMRGLDEREVFARAKKARMQTTATAGDPSTAMAIVKQIVTVNGEPPKAAVLMEKFVKEDLSPRDRAAIRISTDEREPGIDTRVYPSCSACGFSNQMNMPWDAEFFQPSSVS